jgi:amino acid transporter
VGVLAPTLAMSATGVEPARLIGRAAPLAFLFAALGVGVVAYGFVRLSSEFSHAGSVYAFAGRTLGPRAGFLAGWALTGTYLLFPAVSMSAVGVFGQAFLESTGIAPSAPWLPLSLGAWALIVVLASRDMRVTTRSLLVLEGVSVALIVALTAVIYCGRSPTRRSTCSPTSSRAGWRSDWASSPASPGSRPASRSRHSGREAPGAPA